jgi:zinc protease
LRRAVQFGFSAGEVQRELKEWRASIEDAVAKQGTRDTKELAGQIVGSFSGRTVFSPPIDQLARFERIAPSVTPESVLAALREIAGGQGPLVFVSSSNCSGVRRES